MGKNCEICGKECSNTNIRIGVCWDCANFESIIDEGVNMNDIGLQIEGKNIPAKTARQKLILLKENNLLYKKEISYIKTTTTTVKENNFFKNWKLLWWFIFVITGLTIANVIIGFKLM